VRVRRWNGVRTIHL